MKREKEWKKNTHTKLSVCELHSQYGAPIHIFLDTHFVFPSYCSQLMCQWVHSNVWKVSVFVWMRHRSRICIHRHPYNTSTNTLASSNWPARFGCTYMRFCLGLFTNTTERTSYKEYRTRGWYTTHIQLYACIKCRNAAAEPNLSETIITQFSHNLEWDPIHSNNAHPSRRKIQTKLFFVPIFCSKYKFQFEFDYHFAKFDKFFFFSFNRRN